MPEEKTSWVIRLVVPGIVLAILVVCCGRRSADARGVRQFDRNRPAFVELQTMLATPPKGNAKVTDDEVWSMQQYHRYQALLRQAHVMRVFHDGETLHFQIAGSKNVGKGRRITIAWTEAQPDCVISNLDDFSKLNEQSGHAYRPLGNNWYLYIAK